MRINDKNTIRNRFLNIGHSLPSKPRKISKPRKVISFVLLLTALSACTVASQSNVKTPVLPYHELSKQKLNSKHGKPGDLFGYSIAYQQDIKSLVVGSPKEDKYGRVHLCPANATKSLECNPVQNDNITKSKEKGPQDTPWFGASVDAGKSFFVACAPRFVEKDTKAKDVIEGTYGQCFYKENKDISLKNTSRIEEGDKENYYEQTTGEKKPNKTKPFREYWFDTFGLSSYIHEYNSTDSYKVFIGGPAISVGRVMVTNHTQDDPKLVSVERNNNRIVRFNFGYSITSGYFLEPGKEIYAISTPYGTIGYGRVYFYDHNITQVKMWAEGKEASPYVGALFGAALTSLRREDGRSALLVGAPAYALLDGISNVGAVFIYNKFHKQPVLTKTLQGNKDISGYFGATIICVGDFDGDQIDEVAIAAPLENNGRGTVYIYSGKHLLDDSEKPPVQQKLFPEETELPPPPFNGLREIYFGWSLRTLTDSDDNGCNELAVGAPGVNYVTLYRCIASVTVIFDVQFPDLKKQADEVQTSSTSFKFTPCFNVSYSAKPDPGKIQSKVEFSIKLDHQDVKMKGFPKNNLKKVDNLGKYPSYCLQTLEILLPKDADYDQDIKFNVSLKLVEDPLAAKEFNPYLVLLNSTTNLSSVFTPSGLHGSSLTLVVKSTLDSLRKHSYLIGSSDIETWEIKLSNGGNAAHGACVRTRLQGISCAKTRLHLGNKELGSCADNLGDLECKVSELNKGIPMIANLTLDTKLLSSSDKQIVIVSEVFTSNCSKRVGEPYNVTINLITDNNITLKTFSNPNVTVKMTEAMLARGKHIEHIYTIINNGVTRWTNFSCEITLPPKVMIEGVESESECRVDDRSAICHFTELLSGLSTGVKIIMNVQPGSPIVDKIKRGKATLVTTLRLLLTENFNKTATITTTIYEWKGEGVPLYIIAVASLVGLLILVILIWAIHECGFLKRQNKEKLKNLIKDVHRQSVRRSMMLEPNKIKEETVKGDKQPMLSSVSEEDMAGNYGGMEYQNPHPVKEFHHNEDDPARVAFQAELEKALSKGNPKGVTKAQIH